MNENNTCYLFLQQLFENAVDKYPNNIALVCDDTTLSYQALDARVNQLSHYLTSLGAKENSRIALFLERSLDNYIAILAILKTGAAYIPIDVEYPDERVNYIFEDANFHSVITSTIQAARTGIQFPKTIIIDEIQKELSFQPQTRPIANTTDSNQLCYVIYTSGSTGKPKGVEISHQSICHYVMVASELYNITPSDRIYQGFSLTFDASLEELWMAFANGATLVACLSKDTRSGLGLVDFLNQNLITVFSTVPTLLSVIEGRLPHLRLLILGGEACPSHLIKRWSRPDLRIVNTYGPTEATVIATIADCYEDKPITIGKPIPGYHVYILDEHLAPLADGKAGELCIGGKGLALGYVNQPALTAEKFISHPITAERLYRTGDLAMINPEGDIVFMGRIDSQIKLRGFRIELNEIEEVMMSFDSVIQAIVSLCDLDRPTLVAYLLLDKNQTFSLEQFKHYLQKTLPQYMQPSLFEVVETFPLLPSGKVNRKSLPRPQVKNNQSHEDYSAPQTPLETDITSIFEEEFACKNISTQADFFYDLGGHSLLAAKIVSRLRKINGMQRLSILDVYNNPTIKQLAEIFESVYMQQAEEQAIIKPKTNPLHYALCTVGQFFGCVFQYAVNAWQFLAVILFYNWMPHSHLSPLKMTLASLGLFFFLPVLSMAITIIAKWLLVGKIKPGNYKLWGWFYFRWWLVQRLQKNIFSPKHLIGSPLINVYYRLLGAKIGKNCFIGTDNVSVLDTLSIGDNTSIGYDVSLLNYIVEDGWLKIGKTNIGQHCFVGNRSLVCPDTILNDHSCLDDMSMLQRYNEIPENAFYAGSPACLTARPKNHFTSTIKTPEKNQASTTLYFSLLHYISLLFTTVISYACYLPGIALASYFYDANHYLSTIFIGIPLGALVYLSLNYISIGVCKRLILKDFKPGTYAIKSFMYLRQWTIVKLLDNPAILVMADSLYLPYMLRILGAKLGRHVEMGEAPHLLPDLLTIETKGFTASSVAFAWPSFYQGQARFMPSQVGQNAFIGNYSFLPAGAKIGDGGLLGCLSTTPPDNQADAAETSWLGSPAVFLPKREMFTGYADDMLFAPSKKTYLARLAIEFVRILSPTIFVLIEFFGLFSIINYSLKHYSLLTTTLIVPFGELSLSCALVGVFIGLKWSVLGRIKPASKPLWDFFIRKLDLIEYMYGYYVNIHFTEIIVGTPFISMFFRALGAKIGKQVFIDTPQFAEFDLISIGDEVCINSETIIDTHLYEDRIFKMSTIDIQEGCNVGHGSMILYNTLMEKNSTLGSLSLLMKGETLPSNTRWHGTPAQPESIVYSSPIDPAAPHKVVLIVE